MAEKKRKCRTKEQQLPPIHQSREENPFAPRKLFRLPFLCPKRTPHNPLPVMQSCTPLVHAQPHTYTHTPTPTQKSKKRQNRNWEIKKERKTAKFFSSARKTNEEEKWEKSRKMKEKWENWKSWKEIRTEREGELRGKQNEGKVKDELAHVCLWKSGLVAECARVCCECLPSCVPSTLRKSQELTNSGIRIWVWEIPTHYGRVHSVHINSSTYIRWYVHLCRDFHFHWNIFSIYLWKWLFFLFFGWVFFPPKQRPKGKFVHIFSFSFLSSCRAAVARRRSLSRRVASTASWADSPASQQLTSKKEEE